MTDIEKKLSEEIKAKKTVARVLAKLALNDDLAALAATIKDNKTFCMSNILDALILLDIIVAAIKRKTKKEADLVLVNKALKNVLKAYYCM